MLSFTVYFEPEAQEQQPQGSRFRVQALPTFAQRNLPEPPEQPVQPVEVVASPLERFGVHPRFGKFLSLLP